MNGVLNIIKPPSMSSAKAVAIVKRLVNNKVGHAGTLDPEACGVLPIMVGRATKLFDYISQDRKTYIAEIAFGQATDTQDAQGKVILEDNRIPSLDSLKKSASGLTGEIMQVPPMFSALKLGGERLYDIARKGIDLELSARPCMIYSIDVLGQVRADSFMLKIDCGKGTYIRTLCYDIAKNIGYLAHMRFLLRVKVGAFDIENALSLDELENLNKTDLEKSILKPDSFLGHVKRLNVKEEAKKRLLNGVSLAINDLNGASELNEGDIYRLYCEDEFIAISKCLSSKLKLETLYKI